ncbi:hypothetical protein LJC64_04275 [Ruminococcaceae bacterium OttesenSCG-928-A11]|nr:hypothetical protein [Ruminococcaceae bacterium OttesenSCG-928-A11]
MKKTWKKLWVTLLALVLLLAVGLPVLAAAPGETEAAEAPPATATDLETPGRQLDENSLVVESYAELKQALGEDNGLTTIYLGANITAESGAIPVHSAKAAVVIDGSPPTGGRFTFTQHSSGGQNGLFTADGIGSKTTSLTLRNLDIAGKSDLGVARAASGAVITLENVNYTGPQALYHRGGTVRVIGGSYTLPSGELAEALHVELGGTLVVEGPPANAVLWLTSTASTLKVLPGAAVQINTSNYFIYGTIASAHIGANARLGLVSRRFGFSYAADSVGTFTVDEGAALDINLHTTESYAALRVSRRFEMAPGSSAAIVRTGTAGISLRLTAAGGAAVFNQPQRVFFYSSAGVPLRFTGAGTLSMATTALNVWQTTPWPLAEGMDTLPAHLWNKAGGAPMTVEGTYYDMANRGLTHNLTADDPVDSALDATGFNLEKSQLLAFGTGLLEVDAPAATATALTGKSTPDAGLLAAYTLADGQAGTAGGTAGAAGQYSLPVSGGALEAGSTVDVVARQDGLFLRGRAVVQAAEAERLAFVAVPQQVNFGTLPVPSAPAYAERQQAGFEITVQDTRATPRPWRIDASLAAPAGGLALPAGAVVFTTGDGAVLPLGEAPQTVYRHSGTDRGTVTVQWGPGEGVLLSLVPGAVYSGRDYGAVIHWSLVDAP